MLERHPEVAQGRLFVNRQRMGRREHVALAAILAVGGLVPRVLVSDDERSEGQRQYGSKQGKTSHAISDRSGARGRTRTDTGRTPRQILSLLRLPFRHSG